MEAGLAPLDLAGWVHLTGLACLAGLSHLTGLACQAAFSCLTGLASLAGLSHQIDLACLTGVTQLIHLTGLTQLTHLTGLTLAGVTGISPAGQSEPLSAAASWRGRGRGHAGGTWEPAFQ